jgi:hypothetical protein
MREEGNTPLSWDEVDRIVGQDNPRWVSYKVLHRLEKIEERVDLIFAYLTKFDTSPVTAKINMEGTNMSDISVQDTQGPLSAVVSFADVHGHPTSPSDVPQWSSSTPDVATVDASADPAGLAAVVSILGPGATVISVSSAGADGNPIAAAGTVTVTSGPAATGSVEFSLPEPPVEPPAEEVVA